MVRLFAPVVEESKDGSLVWHADYLALQSALGEALAEWQGWVYDQLEGTRGWLGNGEEQIKRIAELRKLYLEEKS